MRLEKRLLVNGHKVKLGSDKIDLGLNRVGVAEFEVLEDVEGDQGRSLVEFYTGVAGQAEYKVFHGALMEITPLGPSRQRLVVKELCTMLEMSQTFNFRRASPREVLSRIEQITGLTFLLPVNQAYLEDKYLRNLGKASGLEALARLGTESGSKDLVWYQLPDSQMYWGHWAHGPFTKNTLPVDAKLVLRKDEANRTLDLPYIPALRPGMVVQAGFRFLIESCLFAGDKVTLGFRKV